MAGLLRHYQQFTVPASSTFAQVVHTLAAAATKGEEDTALLFDAIIRRECLNSQIFPDQGFALLHCRTQTIRQSLFYTCVPDGPAFEDDYFKGIATVLLLIMPEDEYRQVHTDVLGFISSSLVSDDAFTRPSSGTTQKNLLPPAADPQDLFRVCPESISRRTAGVS